jgi:Na+-transporting NADH:ubiquinone oxidoreductase subunit A
MREIKLKKGLDIKLKGKAKLEYGGKIESEYYGIKPTDYRNLIPKPLIKVGEKVKAGSIVFCDKKNEQIVFTSPVSGELTEIVRGERRKILEFVIKSDDKNEYEIFKSTETSDFSPEQIKERLIKSGLWTKIVSRPYGIIPRIDESPKAIHISTFDSSPLGVDYNYTLKEDIDEFQIGVNILSKLSKVYVNIDAKIEQNIFRDIKNAEITSFFGPHPAGNTGTQIHFLTPINKGDKVWTVNPQDVVFIGRLFKTGKLNLRKKIALAGYEVSEPKYYELISGAKISNIVEGKLLEKNIRIISGNVLTGQKVGEEGFLGSFDNLVSVIREGNYYEMLGWAKPGWNKYSASPMFLSFFRKKKEWELDTNLHGGVRPFVLTGKMEKVIPIDIFPMHLLKACIAEDVDMIEKLGIYEVLEEDFALAEFISETKMNFQEIISSAINLMMEEMGV